MTAQIAVYVQSKYAKQTYNVESYDIRQWPGMELIKDVLIKAGYEVDYCSAATVTDFKIILMSITCPIDWYSFISERVNWVKGDYTVIVGGAGNLNIRPVLAWADLFVFGRAEDFVIPLVQAVLERQKFVHPSVCYAADFSMERTYKLAQATRLYPPEILKANGKPFKELAIGCRRKCLFCGYTWQRKFMGGEADGEYNDYRGTDERTIFDYNLEHLDHHGPSIIIGVDGCSERLRFAVNKPITDDLLKRFLVAVSNALVLQAGGTWNVNRVKLFNIIGYPTETAEDYAALLKVIQEADEWMGGGAKRLIVLNVVSTPFKAMPGSPAAVWPMMYKNLRYALPQALRVEDSLDEFGRTLPHQIWEGQAFAFKAAPGGTEGLPTIALWALMLRGTEADADLVRKIATSRAYQNADTKTRQATIEKYFDIDRLFRAYTWDELPTRYLESYIPNAGMAKLSDRSKYWKMPPGGRLTEGS